jgi:hypothetical protein
MAALPIAAGLQRTVRALRVDLPGDIPVSDAQLRSDDRAPAEQVRI